MITEVAEFAIARGGQQTVLSVKVKFNSEAERIPLDQLLCEAADAIKSLSSGGGDDS